MSLQSKTFVETLKEKLKPGVKVYVTSKGAEDTSLYNAVPILSEGVITEVYWRDDDADFTIKFGIGEYFPSEISFIKGWLGTYEMLTPSDKTLLWSMSPNESYVDTEGNFNRYSEEEEIARVNALPNDENLVDDMVKSPKHYKLFPEHNLEIKDVNKRILDNIEKSGFDMTLYEAGWLQQALQYQMRAHEKNGLEDYKKAIQTLQFVVDSMEERKKK